MTNSINRRSVLSNLSRRVGPVFADMAADFDYPAGWGTSPRRAPKATANPQMAALKVPAKAYKPAHGGYPGTPVMSNPQQVSW